MIYSVLFATPVITELASKDTHAGVALACKVHLIRPRVMTPRCRLDDDATVRCQKRAATVAKGQGFRAPNRRSQLPVRRDSGPMLRPRRTLRNRPFALISSPLDREGINA